MPPLGWWDGPLLGRLKLHLGFRSDFDSAAGQGQVRGCFLRPEAANARLSLRLGDARGSRCLAARRGHTTGGSSVLSSSIPSPPLTGKPEPFHEDETVLVQHLAAQRWASYWEGGRSTGFPPFASRFHSSEFFIRMLQWYQLHFFFKVFIRHLGA